MATALYPIVKLVEEQGREELIEPWMEQRLLTVAGAPRLTGKGRNSRTGWEPFRTVLLIMLDSGLRPGEIFRMRWESIHWDKGLIFNPRGKSRKSRRYVPLTERVKAALVARDEGVNEGWVFPSKRAQSGYITGREVSKQWLEAKRLAGIPESVRSVLCSPSLLNRCDGRHRQRDGGDGCDGASISEYRTHLQPLQREADHGSNRAAEPVVRRAYGSCAKAGHKSGHSRIKQPCEKTL
jgi:integrase